jgi:hypothetical protein
VKIVESVARSTLLENRRRSDIRRVDNHFFPRYIQLNRPPGAATAPAAMPPTKPSTIDFLAIIQFPMNGSLYTLRSAAHGIRPHPAHSSSMIRRMNKFVKSAAEIRFVI